MNRYFSMMDDLHVPGRWYLAGPVDQDGRKLQWRFNKGEPVQVLLPVRVPFNKHIERGLPVDYTVLGGEVVPVVHVRVAQALVELAPSDVQIIPVEIEGQPDQFCIINVIRVVKCIDDAACEHVEYFTTADGKVFADQVGTYSGILGLSIDKTKVGDEKVFRPHGFPVVIIVSEEIKLALERIKTTGVKFTEV